jgi:hypothetical protein
MKAMTREEILKQFPRKTLLCKRDGRIFLMMSGMGGHISKATPVEFERGKHNYSEGNYNQLKVGTHMQVRPLYGNKYPLDTYLVRLL